MGRAPCCSKLGLNKGPWTSREDTLLTNYIQAHGEGQWSSLPKKAGLLRCGKSCRLRWINYVRPDIKRGNITPDEEDLIIRMHSLLGNRWSLIAGRLPGRTDNEIKNYWNSHLSKRLRSQGTDPTTHRKMPNDQSKQDPPITKTRKRKTSNKNTTTTNKCNNHNKRKGKVVTQEHTKVHHPKPMRVSSLALTRNYSFDVSASSRQGREVGSCGENVNDMSWVSFLVGDDHVVDQNRVNGCDIECQLIVPNNNNLETLYEQYGQLLTTDDEEGKMLDSFAESFWYEK